ncbi:MAG: winged helix-turn-helix domain-containing protein [Candidatus Bathyarchaeota archaeon]|nr:winged helix-turn-helix domain-containing protein [Candidatus Bathyarchaeota archaeon]
MDIIADILVVVSASAKKTQIMYKANLSYAVLQKYLVEMRGASLIDFECARGCFILTEKGHAFLDAYREYSRRTRNLEKRLSMVQSKKSMLEKLSSTS